MRQSCFFFSFFKHTKPNVTLQKLVLCVVFHLIYGVCVCVREREWWREREFSPITATLHLTEQKLMRHSGWRKLLRRVHAWEFVCNFFFLLLKFFFFFFIVLKNEVLLCSGSVGCCVFQGKFRQPKQKAAGSVTTRTWHDGDGEPRGRGVRWSHHCTLSCSGNSPSVASPLWF